MVDEMTIMLDSPITDEQWDDIMDVDFDRTDKIYFHTKNGKEVEFIKRKTGRWIVDDEYIDCSVCRREKWSRVPFEDLVKRFRYCPNCGSYNGGDVI